MFVLSSQNESLIASYVFTIRFSIVSVCFFPTILNTGESQTEKVVVLNPVSLTLECTWTGNQNKLPNITGYWRKDGDEIENSRLTVQLENEQYNLKRE